MKKKLLSGLIVMVLAVSMTACGGNTASSGDLKNVGVIQLVEHVALDATYEGFIEGLKEGGYEEGKNIKIDFNNAQGDQPTCVTIASKLVNAKSDIIFAIATPAAQAVASKTTDIPIVISAVTDPVSAELIDSNEVPGTNVTGTSDLTPVAEQIKLLMQLAPETEKVAILYNSSETNSEFQAELAKEVLDELGIEHINATISNTNELQSVVQSLVGKVDAIYSPTDNLIANGIATVAAITTENKIPFIVGEGGMVGGGALATYGINYFTLGKQTGIMAAKILNGEAEPATMPIEYNEEATLIINKAVAEAIGIIIPSEIENEAVFVE
jgi:ABC-type uncharacterized transport system, periplasmic component